MPDWEISDQPLQLVNNGRDIVRQVWGVEPTSEYRSPDDPLSKANPHSDHINSHATVDVAPIPGVSFDDYVKKYEDSGYHVIRAYDESGSNRPSWATGPNWHVTLAKYADAPKPPAATDTPNGGWEISDGPPLATAKPVSVGTGAFDVANSRGAGNTDTVEMPAYVEARQQDIENMRAAGVPYSVAARKYPEQFQGKNAEGLQWYFDKANHNVPIQWVAPALDQKTQNVLQDQKNIESILNKPADVNPIAQPIRSAVKGILPAIGGGIGAIVGGGAGLPGGPVAVATGLGGAMLGASGGEVGNQIVSDLVPNSVKKYLGFDDNTSEQDIAQHPYIDAAMRQVPNLIFGHPSWTAGASRLENLSPYVAGAALGGGQEAVQEYMTDGKIDPKKLAIAMAANAMMGKSSKLAEALGASHSPLDHSPAPEVPVEAPAAPSHAPAAPEGVPDVSLPSLKERQGELPLDHPEPAVRTLPDEATPDVTLPSLKAEQQHELPLPKPEPRVIPKRGLATEEVQSHVDTITKDWKNSPGFDVVQSVSDLPEHVQDRLRNDKALNVPSFVDTDTGRVTLISDNIPNSGIAKKAIFHEALGHIGLANKFGEDLDTVLTSLYDNNKSVQEATDAWIKKSKGRNYGGDTARAVEEVLAKRSEEGQVFAGPIQRIKTLVRQYARRMGLKLAVTDNEVMTMIAGAHRTVTEGKTGNINLSGNRTSTSGNRYMVSHNDNESPEEIAKAAAYSSDPEERAMAGHYWTSRNILENIHEPDVKLQDIENVKNQLVHWMGKSGRVGDLADEIYKNLSKASEEYLRVRNASGLTIQKAKQFLHNEKGVSGGELYRMKGSEALQRAIDEGYTDPPGNKYMRPEDMDEEEMKPEPEVVRGMRFDKLRTDFPDTYEVLRRVAAENEAEHGPLPTMSHAEIRQFAADEGTTFNKVMKSNLFTPEEMFVARQFRDRTAEDMAKLYRKSIDETLTAKENRDFLKGMVQLKQLSETIAGVRRQNAQLQNQFKMVTHGRDFDYDGMLKYMAEHSMASPADAMEVLAKQSYDPAKVSKVAREMFTPYWEDYITTAHYSMMLSGIGTQAKNFLGNTTMIVTDMADHAMAGVGGQLLRRSTDPYDRIPLHETAFRWAGIMNALKNGNDIWRKTAAAYKAGSVEHAARGKKLDEEHLTETGRGKLTEQGAHLLPKPMLTEYSKNLLSGADAFFRAIITQMNLYGLAYRRAFRDAASTKMTQKEISDRAYEYINDRVSNLALRKMAEQGADTLLLIDQPSFVGQAITKKKARQAVMSGPERAIRFAVANAIPFSTVNDNIARAGIRHSILGFLDRNNKEDWAKGTNADKSLVLARVAVGTTVAGLLGYFAYNGKLTKDKNGNAYFDGVPLSGLDNVSAMASIIAGMVGDYKSGKLSSPHYADQIGAIIGHLAENVYEVSASQSLGQIFDQMGGGSKANAYFASLGSSFVVPSIGRQISDLVSPDKRDTVGDGSMTDRFKGQVEATYHPSSLPKQVDAMGRPQQKPGNILTKIIGIAKTPNTPDTPVDTEIARLSEGKDKSIVTMARKSFKLDGNDVKLKGQQYQDYQARAGKLIYDTLSSDIQTPEWKAMTDDEKRARVKEVITDARSQIKDEMFSGEVPTTATEASGSGWEIR